MITNRSPYLGAGLFTGFTRLSKGLAAIIILVFTVSHLFPWTVQYLALVPGKTIPFVWNLVTAGYLEQSIFGLFISIIGLLFSGKVFEPIWGSKEFLKFIMIVNILASISVFVTYLVLYYVTRNENFLYTPLHGFYAVLAGFLVGFKQIMPDQEIAVPLKLRVKWLPSILVLVTLIVSILAPESASYLPFTVFGTYEGWLYLRYLQRKPETNLKGDPSDEFSFATFFPSFLRSAIDLIATIFEKIFCGRSQPSIEEQGHVLGGMPLPGSDPAEAYRRRERGARALEERLAAAKTNETIKESDKSSEDASANV